MTSVADAKTILNRDFLETRAQILSLAAALDRLDRAAGSAADDPRLAQLQAALEILQGSEADRAARVQQVFSRPYDPAWRRKFAL